MPNTYADIAFYSWEVTVLHFLPDLDERAEKLYLDYLAWFKHVGARLAVQKILQLKSEAMSQNR